MYKQKLKQLRFLILIFAVLLGLAAIVFLLKSLGYGMTYQVSSSMPEGFYMVRPIGHDIYRGEIIVFIPPTRAQQLLLKHHWSPERGVLMKRVAAGPGDHVCYYPHALWINHQKIAPIFRFYAPGRALPQYHFCGKLQANQYLLMSTAVRRSFDSRYFGPIGREQMRGEATKIF